MNPSSTRPGLLRLVTCGSVDDGKSTLIGRLLLATGSVPQDHLAALEVDSKRWGTIPGELDPALLLDGLMAEREQGITIDVAYRYFATARRSFIVADSPGHEQYTRNMVTGASNAEVAVVLVDAGKGMTTQTHRHLHVLALLRVPRICLAVNKIDTVGDAAGVVADIAAAAHAVARRIGLGELDIIPVSARRGDNVVAPSPELAWYDGPTLLEYLESVEVADTASGPMRLPVQLVLRPDDSFRGLAGTLTAGTIAVGDRVRVAPSGRTSSVARLVTLEGDLSEAHATEAVTVVLADEVDVARGDVLCPTDAPVEIADMFHARVVWMDDLALVAGRPYLVKLAASTVGAVFSWPHHRIDVATGAEVSARTLALNEIGTVDVTFDRPVAFETYECSRHLGGFIVIDRVSGATVGAGMILHARRRANEVHWQASSVDRVARERLGGHRGALVWFTGLSGAGKSTVADLVERRLHQLGMRTYLLDGDNLRHGLNADLGFQPADRIENIRRVGEVGRLMVDAGLVVLASFISPYASDRAMVRQRLGQDFIEVFVDAPLAVCEARDPKGLYARARRGELADFTGIDAPYEAPEHPEIRLDTARLSAIEAAEMVVAAVQARSER